jgi:hypothetical protein
MNLESALSDRILEVATRTPSCRVEDLVYHFPDLMCSQVIREVASLSRNNQLRLMLNGRGITVKNARSWSCGSLIDRQHVQPC